MAIPPSLSAISSMPASATPAAHRAPFAMTLLQLTSDQTWPNFLPVLGYRPSHVIFLTSHDATGEIARSLRHLAAAAAALGCPVKTETLATSGASPTLTDCLETLARLTASRISLINLTGGVKIMSLAAYQFAHLHRIPSFYLDTRRGERAFEDCLTGPHDVPFPDLASLSRQINVKVALQAQGFPAPPTFKKPAPTQLAFALRAAAIRSEAAADREISKSLAVWRTHLTRQDGDKFLAKGKLRRALQTPISASPGRAWHRYLTAAAELGLLQQLEVPHEFRLVTLDPLTANADDLHSQAEHTFKLLEGIWFELAVFHRLRSHADFSDLRWSVEADQAASPHTGFTGETDLVAFNHRTLDLHFISCKTTGPHANTLDHLQGLRGRATRQGGRYAQAELWIFRARTTDHRRRLETHCWEQDVSLHVYTEERP